VLALPATVNVGTFPIGATLPGISGVPAAQAASTVFGYCVLSAVITCSMAVIGRLRHLDSVAGLDLFVSGTASGGVPLSADTVGKYWHISMMTAESPHPRCDALLHALQLPLVRAVCGSVNRLLWLHALLWRAEKCGQHQNRFPMTDGKMSDAFSRLPGYLVQSRFCNVIVRPGQP
jgi:hypothetical protein